MKSFKRGLQSVLVVAVIMAFTTPLLAQDVGKGGARTQPAEQSGDQTMSKSEVDSMINQTERDILLDGIKRHVRQLPAQAKVETKCPDKCGRIAADLDIVQKRERGVVQRIDDILNKITATEKEIDEIKSIQKDLGLSEQGKAKLQKAETNLKVYEGFQKEIPGLEKELLDLDAKETALENQLAACERQCLCEKGKGFADQASCERACPRESEFTVFSKSLSPRVALDVGIAYEKAMEAIN